MRRIFINTFHDRIVWLLMAPDNTISQEQFRRGRRALCGAPTCDCLYNNASGPIPVPMVYARLTNAGRYQLADDLSGIRPKTYHTCGASLTTAQFEHSARTFGKPICPTCGRGVKS